MGQESVQNDHRALKDFERGQFGLRPRRIVERFKLSPASGDADEAFLQSEFVAARNGPHTAVLLRGVFEREPETRDARRLGVKERRVLMTGDLAADVRLFEDVHRLQEQRLGESQTGADRRQPGLPRKGVEDRVEIVQRVPDFVDRALLGVSQAAVGGESLLFKKEANLVARVEEVIVARSGLLSSRKDRGAASRVEIADEIFGAALQSLTLFTSGEVLDHEEPVAFVRGELLYRKRDHNRGAY